MKLNLLPVGVSKRSSAPIFIVISVILVLVSIFGTISMIQSSKAHLQEAVDNRKQYLIPYANNLATANSATEVIAKAAEFDRNIKLYQAMQAHSTTYRKLYDGLFPYIPSFYRIRSIRAAAADTQTTVTMVGQLHTFQQYADLALALWRIPNVISVQRAGFAPSIATIQPLSENAQRDVKLKPGDPPLPDTDVDRIPILSAKAAAEPQGYQGVGNFGTQTMPKGPMPGWETVTMTVLLNTNIQTPDPEATLKGGGAAPAAAKGGGAPRGGGPPAGSGGGGSGG